MEVLESRFRKRTGEDSGNNQAHDPQTRQRSSKDVFNFARTKRRVSDTKVGAKVMCMQHTLQDTTRYCT
jgi:hypothetical protein